jgi:hypothetical protein
MMTKGRLATTEVRQTSTMTVLKPCGLRDLCGRITAENTGCSNRSISPHVALPLAMP